MSTETKWTPEPWEARRDPCHFDSMSSIGAVSGNGIAEVGGESWRLQEANTARIVACVNALAGIPDPAAFVARAREIERAATCYANVPPQLKGEAFRDLLNALSLPGAGGAS